MRLAWEGSLNRCAIVPRRFLNHVASDWRVLRRCDEDLFVRRRELVFVEVLIRVCRGLLRGSMVDEVLREEVKMSLFGME